MGTLRISAMTPVGGRAPSYKLKPTPDLAGEVRRALTPLTDRQYLLQPGWRYVQENDRTLADMAVSLKWLDRPVPIADMTLAQRRAELGRQAKRLAGHVVDEEAD